jgi:hypothetical protein
MRPRPVFQLDFDAEGMKRLQDLAKLGRGLSVFEVREESVIDVAETCGIGEGQAVFLSFLPDSGPDIDSGSHDRFHIIPPSIIPVREYIANNSPLSSILFPIGYILCL